MDADQRVCEVCLCLVRSADLQDHLGWHRTLTNRPRATVQASDSDSESGQGT